MAALPSVVTGGLKATSFARGASFFYHPWLTPRSDIFFSFLYLSFPNNTKTERGNAAALIIVYFSFAYKWEPGKQSVSTQQKNERL